MGSFPSKYSEYSKNDAHFPVLFHYLLWAFASILIIRLFPLVSVSVMRFFFFTETIKKNEFQIFPFIRSYLTRNLCMVHIKRFWPNFDGPITLCLWQEDHISTLHTLSIKVSRSWLPPCKSTCDLLLPADSDSYQVRITSPDDDSPILCW